jgi:hypothetical protein
VEMIKVNATATIDTDLRYNDNKQVGPFLISRDESAPTAPFAIQKTRPLAPCQVLDEPSCHSY